MLLAYRPNFAEVTRTTKRLDRPALLFANNLMGNYYSFSSPATTDVIWNVQFQFRINAGTMNP
jgi:hypothetical protein